MSTTNKIKWIGSILLAGIFIALALFMGGNWGSDYSASASASTIPIPHIDAIYPSEVRAGSPAITMALVGQNFVFEDLTTRVRYFGNGIDELLTPTILLPTGIYVEIPADFMAQPGVYLISVVISEAHTVPTIPITPWDVESNQVPFMVKRTIFLPIIFE